MITGCRPVYCKGLRVPDGVRGGSPPGGRGDHASALIPSGNASETVFLRRYRPGMVQKPCFYADTARERPRNSDSAVIPFGNGLETVILRRYRPGMLQKQ